MQGVRTMVPKMATMTTASQYTPAM
jgi:hypothetical protein